jgi:hypothetical protein
LSLKNSTSGHIGGQPPGHRYPRHSLAVGSNDRYPKNKRARNGCLRTLQVKFPVTA